MFNFIFTDQAKRPRAVCRGGNLDSQVLPWFLYRGLGVLFWPSRCARRSPEPSAAPLSDAQKESRRIFSNAARLPHAATVVIKRYVPLCTGNLGTAMKNNIREHTVRTGRGIDCLGGIQVWVLPREVDSIIDFSNCEPSVRAQEQPNHKEARQRVPRISVRPRSFEE